MDKTQQAYVVRAAGGKLVAHFLKGNFVGIGFGLDDVRDLNADELRKHIAQTSGGSSYRVGAIWAIVRTFMLDMRLGDWIAVPDLAQDRYLLGQVTGEVEYKADWRDDCSFKLRRPRCSGWLRCHVRNLGMRFVDDLDFGQLYFV